MTTVSAKSLCFGFAAAALAVLTAHQAIVWLLGMAGMVRGPAWSLAPVPPFGVPRLVNLMFWGGMWGLLLPAIYDRLPGAAAWVKGFVFGLMVVVIGTWFLVPLIKGRIFGVADQALFAGFDPQRMLIGLIINCGFGIAAVLIWNAMRARSS